MKESVSAFISLVYVTGANFDTLDVRQQTELIGYFHIIVEQLGAQNLLIDCLCVVQWAFKLIYSGKLFLACLFSKVIVDTLGVFVCVVAKL